MKWNSEHKNDQWVAEVCDYKRNGSFVEIGACSGVRISSCYILEKKLGWNGVAVEPHSIYYQECKTHRKQPVNACVYNYDGEIDFVECTGRIDQLGWASEALSGIQKHLRSHHKIYHEEYGNLVKKACISPTSLLKQFNYPKEIDYIALDTEGSEIEILKAWPWNNYVTKLISIETADEEIDWITKYLDSKDYKRVINPFCTDKYEAHYCHKSFLPEYKFGEY